MHADWLKMVIKNVAIVSQNEIQVKMKFLCFLILIIHESWLLELEDKGNWESN